jgi:hypothetical protein
MTDQPYSEPVSVGGPIADWIEYDGWYRPGVLQFFPHNRPRDNEKTVESIRKHVLDGWRPAAPFISRKHLITAFGSCFAFYVEELLRRAGYQTSIGRYGNDQSNYWSNSLVIKCADGFVNTFSIRYQLEWIFENSEPEISVWHKWEGKLRQYLDGNKTAALEVVGATEAFIVTLGISEVWYSKETGKVLWSAVPKAEYNPNQYGFRLTSVEENRANIARCVELIRTHLGSVPIIFTLSPHPMNATFRPVSCITANSVSKAILRVAIDEFMRSSTCDENVFYFPSYEIVTGYLRDPYGEDNIHLTQEAYNLVMDAFMASYCLDD